MSGDLRDGILIFVEIPKSGSTSVSRMLRQQFDPSAILAFPRTIELDAQLSAVQAARFKTKVMRTRWKTYNCLTEPQMQRAIASKEQQTSLILGHLHFGSVHLTQKRPLYVTIMRSPYDRALSDYLYTRQRMAKKSGRHFYQNARLKAAARYDFGSYLSFLMEHRTIFGNEACRYIIGASSYSDAYECLRNEYFHYGTLEALDKFADELGDKLGLTEIPLHHENKTITEGHASELGANERTLIEQLYDRDLECWERIRG